MLSDFEQCLPACDAVVFSDYGKGGFDAHQRNDSVGTCRRKKVLVDPAGDDYSIYAGATILTPNRSEMREVVGRWKDEAELAQKASALRTELASAAAGDA